jgi:hypothetical protein
MNGHMISPDLIRYVARFIKDQSEVKVRERNFTLISWDDYSPINPEWTRNQVTPIGSPLITATDGSHKQGHSGYGIFGEGKRLNSGFPGKQGIQGGSFRGPGRFVNK